MCETLISGILGTPALVILIGGTVTAMDVAIALILLFLSVSCIFVLSYGFIILILRLKRAEFSSIGYIFIGFRDYRRILPASLLLSLGTILSMVICEIGVLIFRVQFQAAINAHGMIPVMSLIAIVFMFLSVIVLLRFVFVWPVMWDNPSMRALTAFRISMEIIRHRIIRFVEFELCAGGKSLVIAVSLFVISAIMPSETKGFLNFLMFILGFVYFISLYSAAIRMLMALPVFYDSCIAPPAERKDSESVLPPQLRELPDLSVKPEDSTDDENSEVDNHSEPNPPTNYDS